MPGQKHPPPLTHICHELQVALAVAIVPPKLYAVSVRKPPGIVMQLNDGGRPRQLKHFAQKLFVGSSSWVREINVVRIVLGELNDDKVGVSRHYLFRTSREHPRTGAADALVGKHVVPTGRGGDAVEVHSST